jgi:type II secretory pathway component PulM
MTTDIIQLEAERWEWSQRLFTDATAESGLLKMEEEVKEIREDLANGTPNPTEYADAIMCLMDSAARAGLTATDVMKAYAEKVRVNIHEREWKKNPDNTYSHVKK